MWIWRQVANIHQFHWHGENKNKPDYSNKQQNKRSNTVEKILAHICSKTRALGLTWTFLPWFQDSVSRRQLARPDLGLCQSHSFCTEMEPKWTYQIPTKWFISNMVSVFAQVFVLIQEAFALPQGQGTADPTKQVPRWLTAVSMVKLEWSPARSMESGHKNPNARVRVHVLHLLHWQCQCIARSPHWFWHLCEKWSLWLFWGQKNQSLLFNFIAEFFHDMLHFQNHFLQLEQDANKPVRPGRETQHLSFVLLIPREQQKDQIALFLQKDQATVHQTECSLTPPSQVLISVFKKVNWSLEMQCLATLFFPALELDCNVSFMNSKSRGIAWSKYLFYSGQGNKQLPMLAVPMNLLRWGSHQHQGLHEFLVNVPFLSLVQLVKVSCGLGSLLDLHFLSLSFLPFIAWEGAWISKQLNCKTNKDQSLFLYNRVQEPAQP